MGLASCGAEGQRAAVAAPGRARKILQDRPAGPIGRARLYARKNPTGGLDFLPSTGPHLRPILSTARSSVGVPRLSTAAIRGGRPSGSRATRSDRFAKFDFVHTPQPPNGGSPQNSSAPASAGVEGWPSGNQRRVFSQRGR